MTIKLAITKVENSVFCKELCCFCDKLFETGNYIYECLFGYVCYDCIDKIRKAGELE